MRTVKGINFVAKMYSKYCNTSDHYQLMGKEIIKNQNLQKKVKIKNLISITDIEKISTFKSKYN